MGLKKCIVCGNEILENASTCIHCGRDYINLEQEQFEKEKEEHDPLGNFKLFLALLFLSAPTTYFLFGETFTVWYFFGLWALIMYMNREKLFSNGCGIKNNDLSTPH